MIPRLTAAFAALPLTLFVLALLPPFFGCFSRASEVELPSHVQGDVDRAVSAAGIVAVIDVESGKILAEKKLDFAGKQTVRPGSTRKPFVLMELLDSGKLDPKQRFICPRPLRIGACGSIAATRRTSRSSPTTPWSMPQSSRSPSSRNIGK